MSTGHIHKGRPHDRGREGDGVKNSQLSAIVLYWWPQLQFSIDFQDVSVNFAERIVHVYLFFYNIAELFMITYLGNEIRLSSSRLSYSLFESKWTDQPHSTIPLSHASSSSVNIWGDRMRCSSEECSVNFGHICECIYVILSLFFCWFGDCSNFYCRF